MSAEDMQNTLIERFKSESDAFFDIYDTLSHVSFDGTDTDEGNQHMVNIATEIAWNRHAVIENLIAKLEGKPKVY